MGKKKMKGKKVTEKQGFEEKGKGMGKDAGQASWNDNDKRCLYICTIEIKAYKVAYVVHAIKLTDLLSSCTSKGEGQGDEAAAAAGLRRVAYMAGEELCGHVGCGLFGSKILFAGGLEPNRDPDDAPFVRVERFLRGFSSSKIYAFDTSQSDATNNMKPQSFENFENFQGGKTEPLLVELQGKLYALAGFPEEFTADPSFEVFDPAVGKWSTLEDPPFLHDYEFCDPWAHYYSYAIIDSTILVSAPNKAYIFCFDLNRTHPEWRIVNPYLFQGGPFPFIDRALVVDEDDEEGNRDHLMFTYQFTKPSPIVVYLVYDDNMETVKSLEMPDDLPPEFRGRPSLYKFAYLGNRKVCLVITQFMYLSEKMHVLVLTLEFSETKRDVQFLGSPCVFEYDTRRSEPDNCRSIYSKLLGCFVR